MRSSGIISLSFLLTVSASTGYAQAPSPISKVTCSTSVLVKTRGEESPLEGALRDAEFDLSYERNNGTVHGQTLLQSLGGFDFYMSGDRFNSKHISLSIVNKSSGVIVSGGGENSAAISLETGYQDPHEPRRTASGHVAIVYCELKR